MKKITLTLSLSLIISCNFIRDKSKIESVLKELSQDYQTKVTYKVAAELSGGKNKKSIEIFLNKSSILEQYDDELFIPASNIALRLLKNNINFDIYTIKIKKSNDKFFEISYLNKYLLSLQHKQALFNKIDSTILSRHYGKLYPHLDSLLLRKKVTKDNIIQEFNDYDSIYGKPNQIITHGYSFGNIAIDNALKKYSASFILIKREKEDSKMSIYINNSNDKIFSIEPRW